MPNLFRNKLRGPEITMASRPIRTLRQPQSFGDEFAALELVPPLTRPKRPKKANNLYETEVTEVGREKKLVLIHYEGYESRFDKWRSYDRDGEYFPLIRQEKPYVLTAASLDDRVNNFTELLKKYKYEEIFYNLLTCSQSSPTAVTE